MKRLLILAAVVLATVALVPPALAAEPMAHSGRVLVSTQGDVTIPEGEQADVVVVVQGNANISGEVYTLVVVEGTANILGARIETVVAVRSQVEVGEGTVVLGEVKRLDSIVHQTGNAEIQGGITDLAAMFVQMGAVLAPALIMIWIGFGLAMIVAALMVAGLAARQVREAERLISAEPLPTFLTGLVSLIVVPIGAIVLFATLIGAPLAAGVLFQVLPLMAFAGYLVAAIWIGDWVLTRLSVRQQRERPYLASVIGVVILGLLGLVPVLGIVVAIFSLLGFGAVIRLGIQAFRGTPAAFAGVARQAPAPTSA
jgi:hypothetical protein